MGPEWLTAKDDHGTRRLDDPADFVRLETAAALRRDIPVIPVLVRSARMPSAEQLPEELKELAYRNCIELTHARWRSDIQLLIDALRRLLGDSSQAGTGAGPNSTTAPAQRTQQEVTGQSKAEPGNSEGIDATALQQVTRELALRIGPIAGIVVKRTAPYCTSLEDVYLKVAEEIESRDEREKFLQGRTPISSAPLSDRSIAATPAKKASRAIDIPPPSELKDVRFKLPAPVAGTQSPSRSKYLLPVAGAGVVVILTIIFAIHFSRSGDARPAPESQAPPQDTHAVEPASMKAAPLPPTESPVPPARSTDESRPKSPQRVRVPQEESRALLMTTILPVYPPLARQAHVQGVVVLDADISKDGAVETLKAISGHPMLIPAAVDAVKQWRYKPYLLKGQSVAVSTQVVVNFTLSGGNPKP